MLNVDEFESHRSGAFHAVFVSTRRAKPTVTVIKFVATSTPTIKKIPKNSNRIVRSFSKANVFLMERSLFDTTFLSRSIGVAISQTVDNKVMKPRMGKQ